MQDQDRFLAVFGQHQQKGRLRRQSTWKFHGCLSCCWLWQTEVLGLVAGPVAACRPQPSVCSRCAAPSRRTSEPLAVRSGRGPLAAQPRRGHLSGCRDQIFRWAWGWLIHRPWLAGQLTYRRVLPWWLWSISTRAKGEGRRPGTARPPCSSGRRGQADCWSRSSCLCF